MLTNELKKGDNVILRNGFRAEVMDNRKGVRRLLKVFGYSTDIGDVYAHDIVYFRRPDGSIEQLEHTKQQIACRNAVKSFFGG